MRLTLTREPADGNAVRGFITPIRIPTLENAAYLIPAGTYRIAVTYSPRFKRPLPLVCDVPVRGSGPATLREYGVPDATCKGCGGERRDNEAPDEPSESRERSLYRRGIRFHTGTRPEHSKGCILVQRAAVQRLLEIIQSGNTTLTIVDEL